MMLALELRQEQTIIIDTSRRDALENALLTIESLSDELYFAEAAEIKEFLAEAYSATEKALDGMEAG